MKLAYKDKLNTKLNIVKSTKLVEDIVTFVLNIIKTYFSCSVVSRSLGPRAWRRHWG